MYDNDIGRRAAQKFDYPTSILARIFNDPIKAAMISNYSGLEWALDNIITEREKKVLLLIYKDKKTGIETANVFNITSMRIRQIECKALRKLRRESSVDVILTNIPSTEKDIKNLATLRTKIHNASLDDSVSALNLSVRSYNVLVRGGYYTIRDCLSLTKTKILKLRNCGRKSVDEICDSLLAYGIIIKD